MIEVLEDKKVKTVKIASVKKVLDSQPDSDTLDQMIL